MDNIKDTVQTVEEINLSKVDWNVLTIKEFNSLEHQMQRKHDAMKANKERAKRATGMVVVRLQEKNYQVKENLFNRLKGMKSAKAKQNLIDEIIATHYPIEEF